jgi:hypothetical protein
MRGNYQHEAPIMKISPQAAGVSSQANPIQHYAETSAKHDSNRQLNFMIVPPNPMQSDNL